MHDRPDLYMILGVEPSATPEEIQRAYRQRIQVVHPDRFDRESTPHAWAHANAMLRELNEAYRVLSDPRLRAEYDRLHAGPQNPSPRPSHGASPSHAQSRTTLRPLFEWLSVAAVVGVLIGSAVFLTSASDASNPVLADRAKQRAKDAAKPVPVDQARSDGGKYSRILKEIRDERAAQLGLPSDALPKKSAGAPIGCEPGVAVSPLPTNGEVWRYHDSAPVAPLEIRVKGANQYLVKLEQHGELAAMMLIRASSGAKMRMPIGDYDLKYAAGSGEFWCGEQARFPFGGLTSFHKADETFSFTEDGDRYSGFTIELFLQPNGNLDTSALSPQDW